MSHNHERWHLDGPPATLNTESGAVQHPPDRWSLLRLRDGATDPFDEDVTEINTGNTQEFSYTIHHARRGCMPTRILLRDGGLSGAHAQTDILRRVDVGQATGVAERNSYRNEPGIPPLSDIEFNPTFGGSILKPNSSRQVHVFPSPPLHFRSKAGDGESKHGAWFESAVVPMEFDSFGAEVPNHHKLRGSANAPGIYWRARQYQRLTINWAPDDSIGDLARGVHEFFAASYFARALKPTAETPDVAALFGASLWLTDIFGKTGDHGLGTVNAELYIPQTQISHDLNGSPPFFPTPIVDWQWNNRKRLHMSFRTSVSELQWTDEVTGATVSHPNGTAVVPTSNGVIAAILSNSNPSIAIGVVGALATAPNGQTTANELGMSQLRSHPLIGRARDENNGQRLSIRTRTQRASGGGRDAGWIGLRFLAVIKPTVSKVRAAIDQLYAEGLVSRTYPLPWHYVPAAIMNAPSS